MLFGAFNITRHLLNHHQLHIYNFIHLFLLNTATTFLKTQWHSLFIPPAFGLLVRITDTRYVTRIFDLKILALSMKLPDPIA